MSTDYLDQIREFALSFEGACEEFSFGPENPVFKAANRKIFAISGAHEDGARVSLKLTPEEVVEAMTLPFVRPAPYLAKNHWVMPVVTNDAELDMTLSWIRRSHEIVTAKGKQRASCSSHERCVQTKALKK